MHLVSFDDASPFCHCMGLAKLRLRLPVHLLHLMSLSLAGLIVAVCPWRMQLSLPVHLLTLLPVASYVSHVRLSLLVHLLHLLPHLLVASYASLEQLSLSVHLLTMSFVVLLVASCA